MTKSNQSLDRYMKAKNQADASIKNILKNNDLVKDETEYAIVHLKEYINFYRAQYNHVDTTYRRRAIREKILNLFPEADKRRIDSYLRKKLVLNYFEFLVLFGPPILYAIFYIVKTFVMDDSSDMAEVVLTTIVNSGIAFFVLSFIVTETSLIRLYPLYKLKATS